MNPKSDCHHLFPFSFPFFHSLSLSLSLSSLNGSKATQMKFQKTNKNNRNWAKILFHDSLVPRSHPFFIICFLFSLSFIFLISSLYFLSFLLLHLHFQFVVIYNLFNFFLPSSSSSSSSHGKKERERKLQRETGEREKNFVLTQRVSNGEE